MQVELPAGLTLRRATSADSETVKAFVWPILREYGMVPDPAHADRGLDHIDTSFQGGGLWLVQDGDEVVGSIGLGDLSGTVCELTKMFLAPAWRGKGLGRRLLLALVDEARARGFRTIELETHTDLKEAVRLYESVGFVRTEAKNTVRRCNLVMRLTLQ